MKLLSLLPGRDRHSLAAPYALNALDDEERARFVRHLDRCPRCTAEVRDLADAVVHLAAATATPAPTALRARVLTAVRTTPQQAPATERTQRPVPVRASRRALLTPISVAATALGLVAAVLFGLQATRATHHLHDTQDRARAIAQVLAAPDARSANGRDENGRGIAVITSARENRAVVTVTGLATPPAGRVHQLWLIRPGTRPRSLGLLQDGTPVLATAVNSPAGASLVVTTEPGHGSPRPTTRPLAQLALPQAPSAG